MLSPDTRRALRRVVTVQVIRHQARDHAPDRILREIVSSAIRAARHCRLDQGDAAAVEAIVRETVERELVQVSCPVWP